MMALRYFIYSLIGLGTGLTTALLTFAEDQFTFFKSDLTNAIIGGQGNNLLWGWTFFTCIAVSLAYISAVLVVFIAPQAAMTGIPELMAYLNGVNNS